MRMMMPHFKELRYCLLAMSPKHCMQLVLWMCVDLVPDVTSFKELIVNNANELTGIDGYHIRGQCFSSVITNIVFPQASRLHCLYQCLASWETNSTLLLGTVIISPVVQSKDSRATDSSFALAGACLCSVLMDVFE